MGKNRKRIIIPKNKDIEEYIEMLEREEKNEIMKEEVKPKSESSSVENKFKENLKIDKSEELQEEEEEKEEIIDESDNEFDDYEEEIEDEEEQLSEEESLRTREPHKREINIDAQYQNYIKFRETKEKEENARLDLLRAITKQEEKENEEKEI